MEFEKVYEPQRFESRWAEWWVESRLYAADNTSEKPVFSLCIPPPNVTGNLHMGHMLEHTMIDMVVRWNRMSGKNTLWLPGTDHAGIATQMVVERQMAQEGLTKKDLGREKFEERVWQWKAESGGNIVRQMKTVGVSCDWTRERFTLDPGLSRAVREVFCGLHERGLVYRGERMVNWCPSCGTALSDLEVKHEESEGSLWHIRYQVVGSEEYLTVATTRPETMLGDTAVAVNPEDERYQHLRGKMVMLPLMNREIPIVFDEVADPKFGTGVVKLTPAHDPNDFEAGQRHKLARIQVIGEDAKITTNGGAYAGLDRFAARKKIVEDLEASGALVKIEPHHLSIGRCERCQTIVEPLVSKQWFVHMKPLADKAIAAVEEGRTTIEPEQSRTVFFHWMRNIRDWCVSRQLWWGHRIPAWHCGNCKEATVARETPTECAHCKSTDLTQETDVLDTWFSSGLWPFSTLGWPDQTADLKTYYPTTLMIMGYEILFFWCARMMMLGIEFMGDVPFQAVHIHGIVRDAKGKKMSKTRGNTVDPLEITAKYGTDAVRMALLTACTPGSDILWTEDKLPSSRGFANKIWNATRFLFLNMERVGIEPYVPTEAKPLFLEERWIQSRLNAAAKTCNEAIAANRYHEAAQTMWHFFWDDFCDWYIELVKLRFNDEENRASIWANLLATYERALRLLHPAMPFLTEELWQRLRNDTMPMSISLAAYPQYDEALSDADAERQIALLQNEIRRVRNEKAEKKLDPKAELEGTLTGSGEDFDTLAANLEWMRKLGGVKLSLVDGPNGYTVALQAPAGQEEAQRKRLEKEIEGLEKVIANTKRQLGDEKFIGKAPAHIVDGMKVKLADYEVQLQKNREALDAL
ncbi:valine--tRNA ligase [Bryobacter aggregatus]|uniref:valine--tRNA ligase n=1 Tax=Bryobacter aggregatus TaxID=360054 RepID=UPI0004E0E4D8|nr:valine--tRNA ligase [Bryobacter aggregatus]